MNALTEEAVYELWGGRNGILTKIPEDYRPTLEKAVEMGKFPQKRFEKIKDHKVFLITYRVPQDWNYEKWKSAGDKEIEVQAFVIYPPGATKENPNPGGNALVHFRGGNNFFNQDEQKPENWQALTFSDVAWIASLAGGNGEEKGNIAIAPFYRGNTKYNGVDGFGAHAKDVIVLVEALEKTHPVEKEIVNSVSRGVIEGCNFVRYAKVAGLEKIRNFFGLNGQVIPALALAEGYTIGRNLFGKLGLLDENDSPFTGLIVRGGLGPYVVPHGTRPSIMDKKSEEWSNVKKWLKENVVERPSREFPEGIKKWIYNRAPSWMNKAFFYGYRYPGLTSRSPIYFPGTFRGIEVDLTCSFLDGIVTSLQTIILDQAFVEAGVKSKLSIYPDGGHFLEKPEKARQMLEGIMSGEEFQHIWENRLDVWQRVMGSNDPVAQYLRGFVDERLLKADGSRGLQSGYIDAHDGKIIVDTSASPAKPNDLLRTKIRQTMGLPPIEISPGATVRQIPSAPPKYDPVAQRVSDRILT
ncbi:MAG: hypothetical protein V1746_02780 [bacterium]